MFYSKNPDNPKENIIIKRCVKIDPDAKIPNLGYAYIYGYADGEKSIDINKISKIIVNSDEFKRRKDYWDDLKDRAEEANAMLKQYGHKAPEDHPELKAYEDTWNEYIQFTSRNSSTFKSRDGQSPYKDLQKKWYVFNDETAQKIDMKFNGYIKDDPTDFPPSNIYGIDYVRRKAGVPLEKVDRWHNEEQRLEKEQKERELAEAEKKQKEEQARKAKEERRRLIDEYYELEQMDEELFRKPEKEKSFWEKVFDRSYDKEIITDEFGEEITYEEWIHRQEEGDYDGLFF